MLVKSAPRALEGPPLSLYPQTGTSCPTGTSPSCSQVGGTAFPGARGEDTLAGRQQKTTLPPSAMRNWARKREALSAWHAKLLPPAFWQLLFLDRAFLAPR